MSRRKNRIAAALADALSTGLQTYRGVKDDEQRKAEREENQRIQRAWLERSEKADERAAQDRTEARAEATKERATNYNLTELVAATERAALGMKDPSQLRAEDMIQTAAPLGAHGQTQGRGTATSLADVVTEGGRFTPQALDLQTIVEGLRKEGEFGTAREAVPYVASRASMTRRARAGESAEDIEQAVARGRAMIPVAVEEARALTPFRSSGGGGGGVSANPGEKPLPGGIKEQATGLARSLATQGRNAQEIQGRLLQQFPGQPALSLLSIAVQAEREQLRQAGGVPPNPTPPADQRRLYGGSRAASLAGQ